MKKIEITIELAEKNRIDRLIRLYGLVFGNDSIDIFIKDSIKLKLSEDEAKEKLINDMFRNKKHINFEEKIEITIEQAKKMDVRSVLDLYGVVFNDTPTTIFMGSSKLAEDNEKKKLIKAIFIDRKPIKSNLPKGTII